MKKTFLLVLFFSYSFITIAQQMSCCAKPSSTAMFASLADDKDFVASHAAPLPYQYDEELGRNITFKTSDGQKANGFEILTNYNGSQKYLFVIHEYWGLNDYIKREAAHYFKELKDVNVIAIDLYDSKIATTPEDAGKLMGALKEERAKAIIEGAIKYVGKKAKIATVGWCMGGGWSLQASLLAGDQAAGCIMYYGMPEKSVDKLKTLKTDVLGLFATKDKWITPEVVKTFQDNMTAAGKTLTVENFDEDHAFANPSNPHYSKESGNKAYTLAINFLKRQFKKVDMK